MSVTASLEDNMMATVSTTLESGTTMTKTSATTSSPISTNSSQNEAEKNEIYLGLISYSAKYESNVMMQDDSIDVEEYEISIEDDTPPGSSHESLKPIEKSEIIVSTTSINNNIGRNKDQNGHNRIDDKGDLVLIELNQEIDRIIDNNPTHNEFNSNDEQQIRSPIIGQVEGQIDKDNPNEDLLNMIDEDSKLVSNTKKGTNDENITEKKVPVPPDEIELDIREVEMGKLANKEDSTDDNKCLSNDEEATVDSIEIVSPLVDNSSDPEVEIVTLVVVEEAPAKESVLEVIFANETDETHKTGEDRVEVEIDVSLEAPVTRQFGSTTHTSQPNDKVGQQTDEGSEKNSPQENEGLDESIYDIEKVNEGIVNKSAMEDTALNSNAVCYTSDINKDTSTQLAETVEEHSIDDSLEDLDDVNEENEPIFVTSQVVVNRNIDPRSKYTLKEELGRGKFGTVFKCIDNSSGAKVAAKFINMRRKEDREDAEREIDIMRSLQHKRLLQLYAAFDDGQYEMCLITELVEGGELFERVINDDFKLTEKMAAIFMRQICEGVQYMHQQNIVHLDMKPENILCVSKNSNRIKLIDFGLARRLVPNTKLQVLFGTPDFASPEVLSYDIVTTATDMWSVGVICYVLLSGLSPFMGNTDLETMSNIAKVAYDFEDKAFTPISDSARDFISKLLIKDQELRMTTSECLNHGWLTKTKLTSENTKSDDSDTAFNQSLDKTKLRKYVVRRRWQKAIHAILALKRMGASL